MEFLINHNLTYILIVPAVMLTLTTILFPHSILSKIRMMLSLGATGFELFHLNANLWALLVTALSTLPFFLTPAPIGVNFQRD